MFGLFGSADPKSNDVSRDMRPEWEGTVTTEICRYYWTVSGVYLCWFIAGKWMCIVINDDLAVGAKWLNQFICIAWNVFYVSVLRFQWDLCCTGLPMFTQPRTKVSWFLRQKWIK